MYRHRVTVTLHDLYQETDKDLVLNKVKYFIQSGWPKKVDDLQLQPYHNVRSQLSLENGIIMRGHKLVIPNSLRESICKELHSSHFGVIKMKAEARRRNSKNSTTDKSPAELLYGKPLRSRLDLIKTIDDQKSPSSSTDLSQNVKNKQCLQVKSHKGIYRQFKKNDLVWVTKNMDNKKFCWLEGIIQEELGNVMFLIFVPELNCNVTRHVDQIRTRTFPLEPDGHPDWDVDVVPDVQSSSGSHDNATAGTAADSRAEPAQ